ncbi:Chromosome transmission fidelity protein 18 [Malassezia caprae]|uniref:Chromosome transmission fidelity protein 18 n=1 Tax=Malassezia caprae TaxID=1381934 RepID=A0AAF0J0Z0_9BASI|nr:Chromosome transmission fidelity protein 18 [Malassezia caprae]
MDEDEMEALLEMEQAIQNESRAPEPPLFFDMDDEPLEADAQALGAAPLEPAPVDPAPLAESEAPSTSACPAPAVRDADPWHAPVAPALDKYVPAEPLSAVRMDGSPVLLRRRRRHAAWRPTPSSTADTPLLSEPLDALMQRARARPARPAPSVRVPPPSTDARMWVDKYQPRAFAELLGDERVHRDALRWLKTWDPCVFHRAAPPARASAWADERAPDPYGRPPERVLLVAGAPGLGKTTLAHVVAQHAGYRVYELNASDARTAHDVHTRVRSALESDSLRGGGKPTLVVIDEIDGATSGDALGASGFVRALVRLLEDGRGAGRGKARARPLLRPIICVCNDLYAPALRPLRPLARVLRYHRAPTPLVTRRLREICAAEKLPAEAQGLSLLCELTHGDLRACLHALELLHRQGTAVRADAVREASLGIKDSVVPLQRVWAQLFRGVDRTHLPPSAGAATQSLVQELTLFAEYERLLLHCFEHYLQLRVPDQGWQRYAEAHDWLHLAQSLLHHAWGGGGHSHGTAFELLGFVPWTLVGWHRLFVHRANPVPEQAPRTDYEMHLREKETHEAIAALHARVPAAHAPFYDRRSLAADVGPALTRILSPDLRWAAQTATPECQPALAQLVDTMLLYGMQFEPERNEHGALMHRLQPSLDVFAQYAGAACDVGPPRHGARPLVQRALEQEQQRRRGVPASQGRSAAARPAPSRPALHDFFGRPVPPPDTPAPGAAPGAAPLRVFYRYHEGYSNAVRKSIPLSALL